MNIQQRVLRSTSIALLALATASVGCGPDPMGESDSGDSETSGSDSEGSETTGEEPIGFLEVGFGETDFTPLEDGGELRVVFGAQGSAMFPMPIRGGEFTLPPDPRDYVHEFAPLLDVELDVDGMEAGFCGHFKCVANYPMSFDILDDGTYEFLYVRVIMPDGIDLATLDGRSAHLRVELSPVDSAPLLEEFDLTMVVDAPPV